MPELHKPRLLVVDDDKSIRFLLKEVFADQNYEMHFAADPKQALSVSESMEFDIALIDFKMPGMNGLDLMGILKGKMEHLIVIMISAHASKELVREAMQKGAYDFFTKPIDINELRFITKRAIDKHILISENLSLKKSLQGRKKRFPEIIGEAQVMNGLFDKLEKIVHADVDVLITGESGTGKELIVNVIHKYSNRSSGPKVEVNCAAIPDTLLESELFGHEKGAFTGADHKKIGRFERANHGTIFLDEISEMNMTTQGKLLRVIQEREVERLGGSGPIKLDFRLVAASNRDLPSEVQEERFREDLYYRLSVIPIHLPPLRERKEDIPLLTEHFLEIYRKKFNKNIRGLSEEAAKLLEEYAFPGNVRQLENLLQQAVVLSDSPLLEADIFNLPKPKGSNLIFADTSFSLGETMEEVIARVEKQMIMQALKATNWKQQETADRLKISRKSLYNKIKKFNIEMK